MRCTGSLRTYTAIVQLPKKHKKENTDFDTQIFKRGGFSPHKHHWWTYRNLWCLDHYHSSLDGTLSCNCNKLSLSALVWHPEAGNVGQAKCKLRQRYKYSAKSEMENMETYIRLCLDIGLDMFEQISLTFCNPHIILRSKHSLTSVANLLYGPFPLVSNPYFRSFQSFKVKTSLVTR